MNHSAQLNAFSSVPLLAVLRQLLHASVKSLIQGQGFFCTAGTAALPFSPVYTVVPFPDTKAVNCEADCLIPSTAELKEGGYSFVGIATRYGLDGPGIESYRFQWSSGLRRGSAADRLLGLRVRVPPGAWLFVLCCRVRIKGASRDNQNKEVQIKNEERTKEIPVGAKLK